MAFDFKQEYKDLYLPKKKPSIIRVPKMNYLSVCGNGNPNEPDGDYHKSIELLYGIAYTLRMSYKTDHKIDGFFEYVVPPLEGFWWQDGIKGMDYTKKDKLSFISLIRLPDYITKEDVEWAKEQARQKKKKDYSQVEFFTYDEGLCVQCLHIGPYDDEPKTTAKMHQYMQEQGYFLDINDMRYHHEIYISDPRKCDPSKLKTVIRHPIKER